MEAEGSAVRTPEASEIILCKSMQRSALTWDRGRPLDQTQGRLIMI